MSSLRGHLHRYWFRFPTAQTGLPPGVSLGYGVTAVDLRDAEGLVQQAMFGGEQLPAHAEVTEDIDVADLDAGHVLPNMGDPSVRGVWFPRI